MLHICGEEIAMIVAAVPGLSLLGLKLKLWWHARHLKNHPKDCPHDHANC
jgi:hypothetical protein